MKNNYTGCNYYVLYRAKHIRFYHIFSFEKYEKYYTYELCSVDYLCILCLLIIYCCKKTFSHSFFIQYPTSFSQFLCYSFLVI